MKLHKKTIVFFTLLVVSTFLSAATSLNTIYQEEQIEKLAPRYSAFLKEARPLMTPDDFQKFINLENNRQRDRFITAFRKAQRSRENVRTLYLLRMTQVLDLTEEQTTKIFPRVNKVEKEKNELNKKLNRLLRELRFRLREEGSGEEELAERIQVIKDLGHQLKDMDKELELFLEENLSVTQQARYLIFHSDFMRTLRAQLEKARKLSEKK